MPTPSYGSTSMIISRTGTDPSSLGFDQEVGGDTPQDQLEAFIERLREQASSQVVEYCDRVFDLVEDETDVIDSANGKTITTRNYPVREIREIVEGTSPLDESKYKLIKTRGRSDRNTGRIERTDGRTWAVYRDVMVTYDWGFEEPPAVVDGAVDDMIVEALEKAKVDRSSDTKQSESMDGFSVTYDTSDVQDYLTLTESMKEKLRPLKRQGMA